MDPNERQRVISALKKAIDLVNERDDDYNGKDIWFDWEELDRICEAMNAAIVLLNDKDSKP